MTPSSGCANLVRRDDHLGPIFEMHGVVVIPLAAPDEAMLLENMDDLPGNLVFVGKAAIGVGLRPCPIVRVRAGNIDRNAETVSRSEERRVGKECRSRWSPYH